MKKQNAASTDAIPQIYLNLFGLKHVPLVPDANGLPRLSVNDLIIDSAQGLCPPRFIDWYKPRFPEYKGRMPWKYQPEYAQLPEYDLATLEECLHYLEIGLVPDTELRLYAFLHALNWAQKSNVVFIQMQEDVKMLMNRKHITYDDKEAVIQGLEEMIRQEFEPYMTLDLEWAMEVKKQEIEEIMLPTEDWPLVDKKINPHGYPLIAMVKDRAGHPIPDLNELHMAMVEQKMLPGYIMNPYDFKQECPSGDYGLLAIIPEYVQTDAYDLEELVGLLRECEIREWRHICIVAHLANYGWKDSPVVKQVRSLKDKVNSPNHKKIAHPFNYLMKMLRNDKCLTIIAPKKFTD